MFSAHPLRLIAPSRVASRVLSRTDCNPNINHRNLMGFCVMFAVFIGSLLSNTVIASKIVQIGSLALPASVFTWALTYPCSDIVAEVYGRKYANMLVFGGFVALLLSFFIVLNAVHMTPASFWPHQDEFRTVLYSTPRVMFAILLVYLISQLLDVKLFGWLRNKTQGRHLWLRNNASTFTSQTVTNILFLSIVFLGTIPMDKWWLLFFSNLGVRYALAFIDTAIVYAGVHGLYKLYPELKAN